MLIRLRPTGWIPAVAILALATLHASALLPSSMAVAQTPRVRKKPAAGAIARKDVPPPATSPGEIDTDRSRAYVYVDKTGLGHEHGIEGQIKSGVIKVGAKADAGTIEFDMPSFQADTERARKYVGLEGTTAPSTRKQVQKNLLGADVLNVTRYPTATFAIESAQLKKSKQGKTVVELKGEFKLHGKSRPLTVLAQATQKDGAWNLKGDFTILQSDFGIMPYTTALGAVGVADQLKIYGDLWVAGDEAASE